MKNNHAFFTLLLLVLSVHAMAQVGTGSRMNEIFQKTDLIPSASGLSDPWEVTYGPDDSLWITEAKGYKVYKLHPNGGTKRTILDISLKSTWLGTTPASDSVYNLQFIFSNFNPQGGLAGLAIHPDFSNITTPKKYVYISYIRSYVSTAASNGGVFFRNSLVRFTYNTTTGRLGNPVTLCDTLPGSGDHNSQRIIIAPVNGVNYLFYAQGDMGAGQFGNANRINYSQTVNKYEGKILRFNLESDGDALNPLDQWIPNDNPFNNLPTQQSAVWSLGIRNNQGFAYAKINGVERLYGSSHGPFSDDEVNILKKAGNYGHPMVIGFSGDGNYDGAGAGSTTTFSQGSLPQIVSESANAAGLANYTDPIYSFYAAAKGNPATPSTSPTNTVQRMYWDFNHGSQGNGAWPSEAPSGMDIYTKSMIPGWKNSLLLGSLKGGKVIRMKLNTAGDSIASFPQDTTNYFRSINRFRDIAISPDGNSIFTIIDKSSTTSGPTSGNPIISACGGCVQKYTFLGYAPSGGTSTIPATISIAAGKPEVCENANTITISSANANYWVPITDTNSNVIAEIYANGNILGNVTTSLFTKTGGVSRERPSNHSMYMGRSITITPQTQPNPSFPVGIRLYFSNAEYTALKNTNNALGQPSGVGTVSSISIFKNSDACNATMASAAAAVVTTNQAAFGTSGYVVQANITSFSSFYFAASSALLPLNIITFKGVLNNDIAQLKWVTDEENGVKSYTLERSLNRRDFSAVATVPALALAGQKNYAYPDSAIRNLATPVVYYRLKITDGDNKEKYSSVVTLYTGKVKATMSVQPNPVINNATVNLNAIVAEQAAWEVTDVSGKTVLKHTVILTKGLNTFNINLSKLPGGIYYLKMTGNNNNQTAKLQKL